MTTCQRPTCPNPGVARPDRQGAVLCDAHVWAISIGAAAFADTLHRAATNPADNARLLAATHAALLATVGDPMIAA